MLWSTPSEKDPAFTALENRLWDTADRFRASSCLTIQEFSLPILGPTFPQFAKVGYPWKLQSP